ncbi:MAG: hypothetical protein ACRDT8_22585, partial [Micromonosporaceae bacterium]
MRDEPAVCSVADMLLASDIDSTGELITLDGWFAGRGSSTRQDPTFGGAMRRTIAGSVAALAAAAVVLTGCSGGSSVDDSQAAGGGSHADHPDGMVVQAYKNIEAESFRFTSTMKVDDRTVSSTGAFDVAEKVGKTNVTMPHGQALKVRMLGEDMYMS